MTVAGGERTIMAKSPTKISGLVIYKAIRGPVARSSGCGAFRNRKKDKKLARREARRECNREAHFHG
jgi:hypothetical protein